MSSSSSLSWAKCACSMMANDSRFSSRSPSIVRLKEVRQTSLCGFQMPSQFKYDFMCHSLSMLLSPSDFPLQMLPSVQFCSVQLLSCVRLFATPWTTVCQASLSITNSQSLLKLMSIESVMPSNHLILFHPFLLPPSIFPSFRVFSKESVLHTIWPKYWNFSFSISPSNEYSGLISFRMDWLNLLAVQGTLKISSNTTVQKHQCYSKLT